MNSRKGKTSFATETCASGSFSVGMPAAFTIRAVWVNAAATLLFHIRRSWQRCCRRLWLVGRRTSGKWISVDISFWNSRTKSYSAENWVWVIRFYRRRLRADRRCSRLHLTLRTSSAGIACMGPMSESPSLERLPTVWIFYAASFRAKPLVEGLPSSDLPVPQRAGLIACKAAAFDLRRLHAVPTFGWHLRRLELVLRRNENCFRLITAIDAAGGGDYLDRLIHCNAGFRADGSWSRNSLLRTE